MNRLSPSSIEQATAWMARLWADDVSEADRQAFDHWRRQHPDHDAAWQRLQQLQQKFNALPQPQTGSRVLNRVRGPSRRQFLLWSGVSAGGLLLGSRWSQPHGERYSTAAGEQRSLTLVDGTRITLDTDTELLVDFSSTYRHLHLRQGRVLITTGHHETPFELETACGRVIPLGTRFSVYSQQKQAEVAVLEGAVELHPVTSGNSARLSAGEQARLTETGVRAVRPLNSGAELWSSGKLAATGQPLDLFLAELARYRPGILQADSTLHRFRVTGVFSVADTDAVLHHLTEVLPVRVRYFTRYWVRVSPRDVS